ncbi:MAG: hypothetical protein K8U57_27345 [Planctomycetes bacterium]|nr:hypothetical protein [Planctomycetota bacterium]
MPPLIICFPDDSGDLRSRFLALFLAHWDEFLRMSSGFRFSPADAEEVVEQALYRVFRTKAERLEQVRNPLGWFSKLVIWAALTHLGRQSARDEKIRSLNFDPVACPCDDYDVEQQRSDWEALLAAIPQLPDNLRSPFVFCQIDGHTIREASVHFRLPLGTVNGRLIRARAALRRILGTDQEKPNGKR